MRNTKTVFIKICQWIFFLTMPLLSFSGETWYFKVKDQPQSKQDSDYEIVLREISPDVLYEGYPVLSPIFYHRIESQKFVKADKLSPGTIIEIDEIDLLEAKQFYFEYNLQSFEHSEKGFLKNIKIKYAPDINRWEKDKLNEKTIYISLKSLIENTVLLKKRPPPPLLPTGVQWESLHPINELYIPLDNDEQAQAFMFLHSIIVQKADDPKLPEIYQKLHHLILLSQEIYRPNIEQETLLKEAQLEPQESVELINEEDATGGNSEGIEESELKDILFIRETLRNIAAIGGKDLEPVISLLAAIPQGMPVPEEDFGEKYKMTSGFKYRNSNQHSGFDYSGPFQSPLVSTANGTVVFRGFEGDYGNLIKIQVENLPIQIWYAHIAEKSFKVNLGEKVENGQVIALMGKTGRTRGRTGVHVHYEVRILDPRKGTYAPINPEDFINLK